MLAATARGRVAVRVADVVPDHASAPTGRVPMTTWIALASPFLLTLLLTFVSPSTSGDAWFISQINKTLAAFGVDPDEASISDDILAQAKDAAEPAATCSRLLVALLGFYLLLPDGLHGVLVGLGAFFGAILAIVLTSKMKPGRVYKHTRDGITEPRQLFGQNLTPGKLITIILAVAGLAGATAKLLAGWE